MNQRTKSLISTIAGFAALALFGMAIIYWAVFASLNLNIGQWDTTLRVLAVLAIVAFSVYLIISPESVGASAAKRSTRLTANAFVASLVAVGIGIALNIIVANVPSARADLTAGQDFTLSDQTIKVIQAVDSDTKIKSVNAVAFYSDQNPGTTTRTQIADLLKEYGSHSSKIKYEFVDPYASPARATELGATTLGTVVFDDGTKREFANTIDEASFTSALSRLMDVSTKRVAFLQGHGERNPTGSNQGDYSSVQAALTRDNYTVLNWNLVTSPTITLTNATVLIIAEPTTALSAKETQAVQSYLDSGGHVLMEVDPAMTPDALKPMAQILQKYGVTPVQGVVIDLAKSASTQDPSVVLVNTFPDHDITRDLTRTGASVVFPAAMALVPPTTTVASSVVSQLIQSSPSQDVSWLETNLTNPQATFDAGHDIPGPVSIGLAISSGSAVTDTTKPNTKLVVYSDADFASNVAIQQVPANNDLFANSVAWLAGANDLVSIRAKTPSAPRTVTLDAGQKNLIFTTTVLGLPVVVLLFGAFTWWRRR